MKDIKITITSKEHFNKFFGLKKGIKEEFILRSVKDLYTNLEQLQKKFNEDEHLNNVDMKLIDRKHYEIRQLIQKNIMYKRDEKTFTSCSLSDTCCFIKHILIYDVLKIKPIYEEDIKDYDELYQSWIHQSDYKLKLKLSPERYILKKINLI